MVCMYETQQSGRPRDQCRVRHMDASMCRKPCRVQVGISGRAGGRPSKRAGVRACGRTSRRANKPAGVRASERADGQVASARAGRQRSCQPETSFQQKRSFAEMPWHSSELVEQLSNCLQRPELVSFLHCTEHMLTDTELTGASPTAAAQHCTQPCWLATTSDRKEEVC